DRDDGHSIRSSRGIPVRELAVPAVYTIADDASLSDMIFDRAEQSPESVPFRRPGPSGGPDVTARRFAAEVAELAKGLIGSGISAGDRVSIMSGTRYEWVALDFAIWTVGAVTVAIYETSAAEQARWILQDSGTTMLIVENEE